MMKNAKYKLKKNLQPDFPINEPDLLAEACGEDLNCAIGTRHILSACSELTAHRPLRCCAAAALHTRSLLCQALPMLSALGRFPIPSISYNRRHQINEFESHHNRQFEILKPRVSRV